MDRRRRVGAYAPAIVPILVGAVLVGLGHGRGAVLLVLGALAAVAVAVGVDLATPMERLVGLIVRWVTNLLSWVVGVLVFLPAWAWSKLLRRDPLGAADGSWVDVEPQVAGGGVPVPRRAGVRAALGTVVLVVLVDLVLGVSWNHVTDSGPTPPAGAVRADAPLDEDDPPDTVLGDVQDDRAELPAMASSPWAEQYFDELGSLGTSCWPFTMLKPRSFAGELVNIRGWERLGHRPVEVDGAPIVALFGGSAAFGEGQRDVGTIASHLSRMADEAGVPAVVRNFGQRGWVLWQEMTLFEQLLAEGERFDVAMFYDGANDLAVQAEPISGIPTHYDVQGYADRLMRPPDGGPAGEFAERDLWSGVVRWWRARSALYRAVARTGVLPESSVTDDVEADVPGDWTGETAERAEDVYRRVRELTQFLSDSHGVEDLYFWQPHRMTLPDPQWTPAGLAPDTVDLSEVLDGHEDVYLDVVHTNEEGARLVAEAIWPELEPVLRRWYAQR